MSWPIDRHEQLDLVEDVVAGLVQANQLEHEPDDSHRDERDDVPVLDEPARGGDEHSVIHGSFILKSAKIFSNFGMMKIMMNAQDAHGHGDDHDRVDHGALDLAA